MEEGPPIKSQVDNWKNQKIRWAIKNLCTGIYIFKSALIDYP